MTDQTSHGFGQRTSTPTVEYRIYFAIIFMISLPWAFVSWALGLATPGAEEDQKGFIARAWHQASIIAPLIFSK